MKFFGQITKVDAEQRMVYGTVSTEAVDAQGEVVKLDAIKNAWADYMEYANVREMHQPSAVGVVKEYEFTEKSVDVGVKVVDDAAWAKVVEGVYKGFSIGGKKLKDGYDKVTKTITGLKLNEISLVDRPANPDALITVYKAEGADLVDDAVEEPVVVTDEMIKAVMADPKFSAALGEIVAKAVKDAQPKPEPSDLRKAFRALQSDPDAFSKGLYDVSQLASTVQTLTYLQRCAADEAVYEGDDSKVPGQLADTVKALAQCLMDMCAEEVAELVATMKAEMPDPLAQLQKLLPTDAISKRDNEALAKASGLAETLAGEVATLRKAVDTITAERDDFKKKYEAQPQEPKGQLIVVDKKDDLNPEISKAMNEPEVKPVLKADGTVDEIATQIKKIHQGGGRPVFG